MPCRDDDPQIRKRKDTRKRGKKPLFFFFLLRLAGRVSPARTQRCSRRSGLFVDRYTHIVSAVGPSVMHAVFPATREPRHESDVCTELTLFSLASVLQHARTDIRSRQTPGAMAKGIGQNAQKKKNAPGSSRGVRVILFLSWLCLPSVLLYICSCYDGRAAFDASQQSALQAAPSYPGPKSEPT
jgi:hypothetical protein